jgi:hypothetical protein
MRTDPADTGGLFIGRRPGTGPVRFRAVPQIDARRQPLDRVLAAALLALMTLLGASFWGPVPLGCMWVGGQVQHWTDTMTLGIVAAMLTLIVALFAGLKAMKVLDQAWILVRRAAGHDQREGAIGRIFALAAAIGILLFALYMLILAGPGPAL